MNKLKSFKNVFKIFSKIFENLVSLKITGLQRFLERFLENFEEIETIFLSHMIKNGKYLPQKMHQGSICDRIK